MTQVAEVLNHEKYVTFILLRVLLRDTQPLCDIQQEFKVIYNNEQNMFLKECTTVIKSDLLCVVSVLPCFRLF